MKLVLKDSDTRKSKFKDVGIFRVLKERKKMRREKIGKKTVAMVKMEKQSNLLPFRLNTYIKYLMSRSKNKEILFKIIPGKDDFSDTCLD